jgi:dihydrofolate synthase / folylpolyglutamate synthase
VTYPEAVGRLLALRGGEQAGMRPGLERIETLLDALGHPERRYSLVQVGGTNGKGSVSVMLAAMLKAAGRRTGLYTSPHLVSFRERIRVNGEPISEDGLVDEVESLSTLVARLDASMFEAATAMALDHFARERVDVAVLEVGLGGRLDATTVGAPAATVITRIDLDHQAVLGPTLAHIAGEKAAIIRSGVAITCAQAPEAASVLANRAAAVGVPLLIAGRDLHVEVGRQSLEGQRLSCSGPGWRLFDLDVALLGTFQPENALLAVAAARALGVPEVAIRAGLATVQWPGRFHVIGATPRLVLDGAHNAGGARALAASLATYFPGERPTFVVGIYKDKDIAAILSVLAPRAGRLILTAAANPRAATPEALAACVPSDGPDAEIAPSLREALAMASAPARTATVCVTGSLSLIGEALAQLGGDKPCPVEKGAASMGLPV